MFIDFTYLPKKKEKKKEKKKHQVHTFYSLHKFKFFMWYKQHLGTKMMHKHNHIAYTLKNKNHS